jgi:hypothetical protein
MVYLEPTYSVDIDEAVGGDLRFDFLDKIDKLLLGDPLLNVFDVNELAVLV